MLDVGRRRAGVIAAVAIVICAGVGLVLRLWPFTDHTYGAYGNDEMAYYSAGAALLRGDLPYADYVFVHPPGIAVALAPFSAFGPSGFVAAKWVVALLGAVNVVLVALCAYRWAGRNAAVIAAAVTAVITPSVLAARTLLIEPFLMACALGAALVLFPRGALSPRRAAIAGTLVAGACFFKAWGVVYFVAALVALLPDRKRTLGFLSGFGTVGFVLALPFVVTGLGEVVRQVVELQFSRPSVDVPTAERIVGEFPIVPWLDTMSVAASVVGAVMVAVVVWAVRTQGALGRFWATALALTTVMFLTSSSFIAHYGEFSGAAAIVMCAAASVHSVRWLRARNDVLAVGSVVVLALVPVTLFVDASNLDVFPGIALNDDFRAAAERYIGDDCFVADSTGFSALSEHPPAYALYGGRLVDDRAAGQDRGGGDSEADLFRNADAKSLAELQRATSRCRWVVLQIPPSERTWHDEMQAWFVDAFEVRETGATGWTLWERRPL